LVQVSNFAGELHHSSLDLSERSNQIRKMLNISTQIAKQTKILSLNANIEAARESQYGRSYAVVANEIRKLADNSQCAVNDISIQINEVNAYSAEIDRLFR
jgi:methyl-accepting chemotaxis protein